MTIKNLAALILRLLGLICLIPGTCGLLVIIVATIFGDTGTKGLTYTVAAIAMSAIYPVFGLILLCFADRIAARFSDASDSPAPVHLTLKTGVCLLSVYFFVCGIHDIIDAFFQIRIMIETEFESESIVWFMNPLVKALVFLSAGMALFIQPAWLRSLFGKFPAEGGTYLPE